MLVVFFPPFLSPSSLLFFKGLYYFRCSVYTQRGPLTLFLVFMLCWPGFLAAI